MIWMSYLQRWQPRLWETKVHRVPLVTQKLGFWLSWRFRFLNEKLGLLFALAHIDWSAQ